MHSIEAGIMQLAARVPLRQVVLFGSCARNRHTAGSDVDLLVVYAGPRDDDVFRIVKEVLAVPRLEPHVYMAAEAAALAPVLDRMTRDGIQLYPQADRPFPLGRGTS